MIITNKRRIILAAVTVGVIVFAVFLVQQRINSMQNTVDQGRGVWQDWLRNRLSP